MSRRLLAGLLAAALAVAGCSDDGDSPAADAPTSGTPAAEDIPADDAIDGDDGDDAVPALADPPVDGGLWVTTLGLPVVAAIRTSTPLARLDGVGDDERVATCAQVATELDAIASPQVLTGLAITADPETATLLTGDLQAKGDLLASCGESGPGLDALVAEVATTHAVAVAWLATLEGGS